MREILFHKIRCPLLYFLDRCFRRFSCSVTKLHNHISRTYDYILYTHANYLRSIPLDIASFWGRILNELSIFVMRFLIVPHQILVRFFFFFIVYFSLQKTFSLLLNTEKTNRKRTCLFTFT